MKIRQRKATRYDPGVAAMVLYLITFVLALMVRSELFRDWFTGQAQRIGPGWLAGNAWAILVVLSFAVGAAAVTSSELHKRKLQPSRDSEASLEGPNALFLRPYFTDRRVTLPSPFYSNWSGGVSLEPAALNAEELVGRVLEPFINVREVGGSSATVGSGRIHVSPEEWQSTVARTIHDASVIVVMPLMTRDRNTSAIRGEGTMWELRYLAETGLMARTMVLMPHVVWGTRTRAQEAWERTRVRAVDFGLHLPPYDKRGAVAVFSLADGLWRPERLFSPEAPARERVAAALIEGLRWMAERFEFPLLDR